MLYALNTGAHPVPEAGADAASLISEDGQQIQRIGGHLAFWFGWFGFYPDTLVYGAPAQP